MFYFVRNLSFWRGEGDREKIASHASVFRGARFSSLPTKDSTRKKFPNKILEFVRIDQINAD